MKKRLLTILITIFALCTCAFTLAACGENDKDNNSVTSIGDFAFSGCESLISIKYRGTEAQWNTISKGGNWNSETGSYTITYNYTGE